MTTILRSAALWLVILVLCLWGVAALAAISGSFLPTVIAGNGATASWGYGYPFFAPSDLAVTLKDASGNPVTVTLNGGGTYDYAISGTLNQAQGEYTAGGTVTFNTAPPAGYTGAIQPAVPPVQPAVFSDYAPLPAKGLEGVLDRQIVVIQQLQAQLASVVSSGLPSCPNNSVLGNVSGVSAVPVCLTSASLAGLTLGGLTVNKGTGTPPALASGIVAELVGANAATARIELDGWAGSALYTALRLDGSPTARAALGTGETIGGFNAWGWTGAAAYGPAASFDIATTEAWSAGHGGAQACIKATPTASATLETEACLQAGLVVGTPSGGAKGLGSVNAVTLWLNGTTLTSAATTAIGTSGAVLGLLNANLTFAGADSFGSVALTGSGAPTNGLYLPASNILGFATNSTAAGVIDASQNWIIGAASGIVTGVTPTVKRLEIIGGAAAPPNILAMRFSADGAAAQYQTLKSRSATPGSFATVNAGDAVFQITATADDGTTYNSSVARIQILATGSISTGIVPGLIDFGTANASGVITNALRIDSSQALLVAAGATKIADASGNLFAVGLTATGAVALSPASQNVVISPTGTGSVTLAPATAGSINNLSLGQATAALVTGTTIRANTNFSANGTAGLASKSCAITTANVSTGITLTITEGIVTAVTTC